MKYIKMLGLLAVAAAAFMAFAGTASATTLTSPAETTYTGTITAVSEGTTTLHGSFVKVECEESHVQGKVEKHGTGVTAGGKISSLSFSKCGNYPVTVKKAGSLEIHGSSPTGDGTLTSSESEIEIHTSVGLCVFTTSGTDIGTLTGSNSTGGNATLHINSAKIPRTGGNFLCGSSGVWTGSYVVTTPSTLEVH